MKAFLMTVQTIVSVLLILSILMQNRSSGLSATFGGGGSFYASKRGPEKVLYFATIVLAVLFVLLSIIFLFVE